MVQCHRWLALSRERLEVSVVTFSFEGVPGTFRHKRQRWFGVAGARCSGDASQDVPHGGLVEGDLQRAIRALGLIRHQILELDSDSGVRAQIDVGSLWEPNGSGFRPRQGGVVVRRAVHGIICQLEVPPLALGLPVSDELPVERLARSELDALLAFYHQNAGDHDWMTSWLAYIRRLQDDGVGGCLALQPQDFPDLDVAVP